jgi:hypothetical protein
LADVSVSYSLRDSGLVSRLVERLQERGKGLWVDVERVDETFLGGF